MFITAFITAVLTVLVKIVPDLDVESMSPCATAMIKYCNATRGRGQSCFACEEAHKGELVAVSASFKRSAMEVHTGPR